MSFSVRPVTWRICLPSTRFDALALTKMKTGVAAIASASHKNVSSPRYLRRHKHLYRRILYGALQELPPNSCTAHMVSLCRNSTRSIHRSSSRRSHSSSLASRRSILTLPRGRPDRHIKVPQCIQCHPVVKCKVLHLMDLLRPLLRSPRRLQGASEQTKSLTRQLFPHPIVSMQLNPTSSTGPHQVNKHTIHTRTPLVFSHNLRFLHLPSRRHLTAPLRNLHSLTTRLSPLNAGRLLSHPLMTLLVPQHLPTIWPTLEALAIHPRLPQPRTQARHLRLRRVAVAHQGAGFASMSLSLRVDSNLRRRRARTQAKGIVNRRRPKGQRASRAHSNNSKPSLSLTVSAARQIAKR